MKTWLLFVVLTVLCWGAYVPTLHEGQKAIGGRSPGLWAFVFVGAAYFVTALLAVGLLAWRQDLSPLPATRGGSIALLAGLLGAVGALGIILALLSGGKPYAVPPLVFAGAPIIATVISMSLHRPTQVPQWPFFAGIVMAAAGVGLILRFKPS